MSSDKLEQIRNQALKLPEAERAELAHDLLKSLDGDPDRSHESAWSADIERRLTQIDEGSVQPLGRDELRRRIRQLAEPR